MDESDFWCALEYRVCAELAGFAEPAINRCWCDGFTPNRYDLNNKTPRITDLAWIGKGSKAQKP